MSKIVYPVPAHDPTGLQQGSRLFGALARWPLIPPRLVLVAPPPGDYEQRLLKSRILIPPAAAGQTVTLDALIAGLGQVAADLALQRALEAAIAGSGALSADLSVELGLRLGGLRATPSYDPEQLLLGSRFFRPPSALRELDAAIAGLGALAADLTVTSGVSVRLGVALPGKTNQGYV